MSLISFLLGTALLALPAPISAFLPVARYAKDSTTSLQGLFGPYDPTATRKGKVNGDQTASFEPVSFNEDTGTQKLPEITDETEDMSIPPILIERERGTGIGGDGGAVYDVNRLKNNLLQETMLAYKQELFRLLNSPVSTEQEIVEKLAALVQASAVRTTTDSNLLDGTWGLAYRSKWSRVSDLRRNVDMKTQKRIAQEKPPMMQRVSGKESLFRTTQRKYCLEELEDDEDPYMVENRYLLGGILTKCQTFAVRGLTRQSLRLNLLRTQWLFLGKTIMKRNQEFEAGGPLDLQFIHTDVDLCIVAESSDGFTVYTKNEEWLNPTKRLTRKVRFAGASVRSAFGRIWPFRRRRRRSAVDMEDPIIREIYGDSSQLRVLKLGDLGSDNDHAWDGIADPFVHLSANERQKVLKAMNVRQIERAGNKRLSKSRRERFFRRLFRRRTYFRKPKDL